MKSALSLAGAISCLTLLTLINLGFFPAHVLVQIALFFAGIGLLFLAFSDDWRWPQITHREILLLIAISGVGLALRTIALETQIHRFVDELHYANAVVHLWQAPLTRILTPFDSVTAFTWLYPLAQTGTISVYGVSLSGLRLPSAILGTLTIPALYFLGRTLFDRRIALTAALLLATFPPHIHFSRLALNNIADPFFGTLALGFLVRGWRNHRSSDYALSGIAIGLTQYFYEGGRLLFPVLYLLVAFSLQISALSPQKPKSPFIKLASGMWYLATHTSYLIPFFLLSAPVYLTFLSSGTLVPRLNSEIGASPAGGAIAQFIDTFRVYIDLPDRSWFYGGSQAMILPVFVPFLLFGVLISMRRWRQFGMLIPLMWILLTSLGNALLRDSAWTPRYVVAFPALALVIALGFNQFHLWITKRTHILLPAALLTLLLISQAAYYFADHVPNFEHRARKTSDFEDALFRARTLPHDTRVYIVVPYAIWRENLETWHDFWRMNVILDTRFPTEIDDAFFASLRPDSTYAFFIEPGDSITLTALQTHFDLLAPQSSPYNVPLENQLVLYMASHPRR